MAREGFVQSELIEPGRYLFIDQWTGRVDTQRAAKVVEAGRKKIEALRQRLAATQDDETRRLILLYRSEVADASLRAAFSDFDGWAVVCKVEDLPRSAAYFECMAPDEGHVPPSIDPRQVEAALLREIEAGEIPKREAFRLRVCPDLNREAFRSIWASVSKKHPELSKPGPKRSAG